jgi:hypothetical protein
MQNHQKFAHFVLMYYENSVDNMSWQLWQSCTLCDITTMCKLLHKTPLAVMLQCTPQPWACLFVLRELPPCFGIVTSNKSESVNSMFELSSGSAMDGHSGKNGWR